MDYLLYELHNFRSNIDTAYLSYCEKYISKSNFGLVNLYDKVNFLLLKKLVNYFDTLILYDNTRNNYYPDYGSYDPILERYIPDYFKYELGEFFKAGENGYVMLGNEVDYSSVGDVPYIALAVPTYNETEIKLAIDRINYILKTNYNISFN